MKKIFFLTLLYLSFISKNDAQDWVNYSNAEGKFSVLVPETPTERIDTSNTYPTYIVKMFVSKSKSAVFVIGWVDYEAGYTFDAQKELEANRDNFVNGLNGKLVSTKNIEFKTYKGIEFAATSDSYYWTSKVFLVGRRPFQLLVGSNTGRASGDENKFFNSFSINQ